MAGAHLSRIVLMVRPSALHKAVNFYRIVGLHPLRVTDTWAELVVKSTPSDSNAFSESASTAPAESTSAVSTHRVPIDTSGSLGEVQSLASTRILLQATSLSNEAAVSTGYSPILVFQVAGGSLDGTVASCVQAGAHLDGPLQYPAHGKVVVLRTPDGHMIGLYEPGTE
jgi:hypothetical protein